MSDCGAAIDWLPAAGRAGHPRAGCATRAPVRSSWISARRRSRVPQSQNQGGMSVWTSVSRRSTRGRGTSATSGIIARRRQECHTGDQQPTSRLPTDQHRDNDQTQKQSSRQRRVEQDRCPRDRATPTCRDPLPKTIFGRPADRPDNLPVCVVQDEVRAQQFMFTGCDHAATLGRFAASIRVGLCINRCRRTSKP